MLLSNVYSWLSELRSACEHYDHCTSLEQRTFYHSLQSPWKPVNCENSKAKWRKQRSGSAIWDSNFLLVPFFENDNHAEGNCTNSYQNGVTDDEDSFTSEESIAYQCLEEDFCTKAVRMRPKSDVGCVESKRCAQIFDVYVNLWDCKSLEIKKADELSISFDEQVEELVVRDDDTVRVKRNCLGDLPSSVVMWLNEMALEVQEEPYDFFEVGSLLRQYRSDELFHTWDKYPEMSFSGQLLLSKEEFLNKCIRYSSKGKRVKLSSTQRLVLIGDSLVVSDSKNNEKVHLTNINLNEWSVEKDDQSIITLSNGHVSLVFESSLSATSSCQSKKQQQPVVAEKKRNVLQRFFQKRQSREVLESRGIYRDETIFGNSLRQLHKLSGLAVPEFVTRTMRLLEQERNIKSAGIYRTSANVATVQTIRIKIDANDLDVLHKYRDDTDVLAGALKMFFRELKVPLIDGADFDRFVHVYRTENFEEIPEILESMDLSHRETLSALCCHLLKVAEHSEWNSMSIKSLAICWGPSICAFDQGKHNPLEFAQLHNQVTELVLQHYQFAALLPRHTISSERTCL